jgi:hypothetical protein
MLKGLEEKKRTRSNRRDMKITLNTFFLVAGSTGAAIVRLWREERGVLSRGFEQNEMSKALKSCEVKERSES